MSEFEISVLIIYEKMLFSGEIYAAGKKFSATGSDDTDKYHLWYSVNNPVYTWKFTTSKINTKNRICAEYMHLRIQGVEREIERKKKLQKFRFSVLFVFAL